MGNSRFRASRVWGLADGRKYAILFPEHEGNRNRSDSCKRESAQCARFRTRRGCLSPERARTRPEASACAHVPPPPPPPPLPRFSLYSRIPSSGAFALAGHLPGGPASATAPPPPPPLARDAVASFCATLGAVFCGPGGSQGAAVSTTLFCAVSDGTAAFALYPLSTSSQQRSFVGMTSLFLRKTQTIRKENTQ